MKRLLFLMFLLAVSFYSCSSGNTTKTVYVGPRQVDCVGVAPQKCLQVKEDMSMEWQNFYGNIEGFDYEPGYLYTLKVKETTIENPPADASSIRWTLIEMLGKVEVPGGG